MKSRLLAVLLSISLLFGSMPAMAAEPDNEISSAGGTIVSSQKTEEYMSSDEDSSDKVSFENGTPDEDTSKDATSNGDTSNGDSSNVDSSNVDSENKDTSNGNIPYDDVSNEDTSNEDISDGNTSNEDSSDKENDDNQDSDVNNSDENTGDDVVVPDTEAGKDTEADEPALEEETAEPVMVEEEDITELKIGDNSLNFVNDSGSYTDLWYSFTASESGYFNFHTDSYYSMYLFNRTVDSYFRSGSNNVYTNYMNVGETVFMRLNLPSPTNTTETLTINKLTSYTSQKQADGSYLFDAQDYTLSILPELGNSHIRVNASIEAGDDTTLDSRYYLNTYLYSPNSYSPKNGITINSSSDYKGSTVFTANAGQEYSLQFLLTDNGYSSGNLTAIFVIDDPLSIQNATDNVIIIHDTKKTETSITIDIESSQYNIDCYYAPTDNSVEEKNVSISNSWKEYNFTYLQPATEYYFQFVNSSSGKTLYETTVSTAAYDINIEYDANISEDGKSINMKADVSGYKGSASYVYLYYEYTDAWGKKQKYSKYQNLSNIEADENTGKDFTIESSLLNNNSFEAGKEYDIAMWLQIDDNIISKEVKKIETPAAEFSADDLELTIEQDSNTPTTANYKIKVNNLKTSVNYSIRYRHIDGKTDYSSANSGTINSTSTEKTGSITSLQQGVEYEFVVLVGGVKKSITKTIGTLGIRLSKVGDDEINAFDFVRTYKLESTDAENVLNGNYSLRLSYLNGSYYTSIGSAIAFDIENSYQAEIKTASGTKLNPDTDYELKWELINPENNGTIVYTLYETIHTKAANITFTETENSSCFNQEYKVTLDSKDISNFANFGSFYLYSYIKKTDSTIYRKNKQVYLSSGSEYSNTINFTGLEANTSYDVVLRTNDDIEYASKTFTTAEDNRQLSITSVTEKLHSAEIKYTLTGITPSMSGYILFYIHEKGSSGAWEKLDSNYYSGSNGDTVSGTLYTSEYYSKVLKDNTEYEYKIGLGDYDTAVADLDTVCEGSFTTKKDNRMLSNAAASASYTSVDVSALLSGNDENIGTYIYLFLKSSADSNWIKTYVDYDYESKYTYLSSYNYSVRAYNLPSGTDYSYMIVASDSNDCNSPDEVTADSRKVSGTFTTKKNNYTFEFTTDESKLTDKTAVVGVTANGGDDDRLRVVFTLSDGQNEVHETVTLKASEDYKGDITFTELIGETQYTITGAYISALEGTSYIDVGETVCDYKFTTKKTEIPEAITLSADEIALNALYPSYNKLDGYNSRTLKADVTPATAARDFIWSSSNDYIATVDANGTVTATGEVGTATITVESVHDRDIKATCEVTVKKYAVGHKNENGEIDIVKNYGYGYSLYKNSYVEGFGLYDYSVVDNPTLMSGYTVTTANARIAEWKENNIYAKETGVTSLDFEKDGVKANLMISVSAEGKGFGITGFTTYSNYPAIKETNGSYTLAYDENSTISYSANIEVSPKQEDCSASDFNWSISNSEIATVNANGNITPRKAGTVTLTVTPKNYYTINEKPYNITELKITLNIKNLPTQNGTAIYALANVNKKIGDVKFPDGWGEGWSWKYPNTPLVTNGVYTSNSYPFEAVYNGTESYPSETTLTVYIGKITGVSASESLTTGAVTHNNVLEVGSDDSIALSVAPISQGRISSDNYSVEIPAVNGLTITQNTNNKRLFTITAQKKGSYTLKPVIKAGDKVIASTTYKIKAVEDRQVASIIIESDTEGVSIVGNTIIFNKTDDKKEFTLKTTVKDRYNADSETALVWKTTDKTVATVTPASKTDTHSVKVTIKGDGHTVLSATAKDAAGFSKTINLEVQDHSPRVDTNKASVNIAYDYNNITGRSYAYNSGGVVEIVPVYGESISTGNVQMRDQTGKTPSVDLKIEPYSGYGYKYLIQPASDSLKAGKYNCNIYVKTSAGNEYTYPVKVTVTDKAPTVSAKMGNAPNLFFKNTNATIYLKISGAKYLNSSPVDSSSVTWTSASTEANMGFAVSYTSYDSKNQPYIVMSQQTGMRLTKGKLADTNAAKGKLSLKLSGYKKEYNIDNFTIKYSYKKPVLVTKAASTNIVPDVGQDTSASFYVYDKTNKRNLYYNTYIADYNNYYYDEIKCDAADIELHGASSLCYSYNGTEKSKKFIMTLDAPLWRESLTASHTMKSIKPTAYLSRNTITYNTNLKSTAYNSVHLKNAVNISFSDIEIKGANAKAQKLLDDNLFVITTSDNYIMVEQSQAEFMGTSVPVGTYGFKVTPYYNNPETNEKTPLNTVTFKLKVVNKAVTAKVSPKGSIDLTYGTNSTPSDRKNTVALVDPKFSNMADEYYVSSYKLKGEYSNYFTLAYNSDLYYGKKYGAHYYIRVRDNSSSIRKLKAGQAYKLAIEYTISNGDGEEFKVTSNIFTIKPKQSSPKVTVTNNNQTMYAGANNLTRTYSLSVPSYYYISSASGSIDCNMDGKADISVSGSSSLTVSISDKDAVGATAKGKTYSIPVTVRLVGRDGIAKDVKTTIKVKVKR